MISLIRGQKIKISDAIDINQLFHLKLQLHSSLTIDIASFGLDAHYRLSDERYMTFYNQPITPCNSIQINNIQSNGADFQIQLSTLDSSIQHIVFTLAVEGLGTMSQLKQSVVSLCNAQNVSVAEFQFNGDQFQQERALMLLEIYKKDGVWRLAAVAQGFNAGLDALIRHFGGEVAEEVNDAQGESETTAQVSSAPILSNIDLKKKVALEKAEKTGNS
ncbi:MAG: tellurium resistance protein, partial [Moraxellaceae bacterium]